MTSNKIKDAVFILFLAAVAFFALGLGGKFRSDGKNVQIEITIVEEAKAESVFLQRGLDQFIFRGMDVLGDKLQRYGLQVEVSSPLIAVFDDKSYDVLIGNSQGAIRSLYRQQKVKPKLIIAIDPIGCWSKPKGIKTYVLYGLAGCPVKGAVNIPTGQDHLGMSFSQKTQQAVIQILIENGIIRIW